MELKNFIFGLRYVAILILFLNNTFAAIAEPQVKFSSDSLTIEQCIKFALENQPLIKQSKLDEEIARQDIRISFSEWLPQISSTAGIQHYLKQPVSLFPNLSDLTSPKIPVKSGVLNNSSLQFSATQNIFTNDLYFAGKTASLYRQKARQTSGEKQIQLVVDVSKAFYDVLLSQQILKIIDEEIIRLTKSLNDAVVLFKNGTTDKIDYSRATISLNNTKSQKIAVVNTISARLTYLRQLMGYPENEALSLRYKFDDMKSAILIDTLQGIRYNDRIEYQLLQTNLKLQQYTVSYYKQNFLPSLSGFANYNLIYQNDNFNALYNKSFPNSAVGLTLSIPLFSGAKRIQNLKRSRFIYDRMTLDTLNLRNQINTEYSQAFSSYKTNLAAYNFTQENIKIARDVYNTVLEQYRQGIKSFLEVIISETDLQTSQINNLTALISLMYSKIDVEQATGSISVNY